MKRLLAAAAALLLCLNILPTAHGMGTSAGSAILMEAESGRVLYEQDADRPRLIASVTKLMTALVALESGHPLEEKVVIREEDTRTEGSSLYLRPGEELRLETLLYGLLLQSGNDAALAVARHCGGTVENFVAQMNLRAARLGMEHSRFANPSGLNAEGHCSTARDLALLARACLKNETLAAIAATRSVTLEGRSFVNHNKLLWRYEGCVGLKTGYTEKAGLTSAYSVDGLPTAKGTFNWDGITAGQLGWAGVGQYHDQVNPCAFLLWMGAIANGGKAAEPYLIRKTVSSLGIPSLPHITQHTGQLIDSRTAATVANFMANNVTETYGTKRFPNMELCAKSGTAEVGTGQTPHAWFAGFLRNEDAPYAFVVLVENGGGGNAVAGTVAGKVLNVIVNGY